MGNCVQTVQSCYVGGGVQVDLEHLLHQRRVARQVVAAFAPVAVALVDKES
jgi:hypothetical protein